MQIFQLYPSLGNLNVDGGADDSEDYIQVRFEIDPEKLPEFWEEISMNLKDVIRHEIEHLTHGEGDFTIPSKTMEDDMSYPSNDRHGNVTKSRLF
jgi:hypothetical protein